MGLAPYGEPKFTQADPRQADRPQGDGSFRLDLSYFDYCTGLRMTNAKFDALFGGPARKPDELLTQRHMDLAASIQEVTEEVVLRMARVICARTDRHAATSASPAAWRSTAWPMARSCATGDFDQYLDPARGRRCRRRAGRGAGGLSSCMLGKPRDGADGARCHARRLSRSGLHAQTRSRQRLTRCGARFTWLEGCGADRRDCAEALAEGKAVGWFQGRMEFGPRALGDRSILGDPRSPTMQKTAQSEGQVSASRSGPSRRRCCARDVGDWFDLDCDSPYMLLVADVVKRRRREMTAEEKQAVRHRQAERPPLRHPGGDACRLLGAHPDRARGNQPALPRADDRRSSGMTGCPVLVNTSFNVRGEPIVCTPEDAFRCFMGTDIEVLVFGNSVLRKEDQDPALKLDYKNAFELD